MENLSNCSSCNQLKVKKYLKSISRGAHSVRSVFADQSGRQWNGKQCPDCRYIKRVEIKEVSKIKKNTRKCLKCKESLEVNYFYHSHCLATMEENDSIWTEETWNGH